MLKGTWLENKMFLPAHLELSAFKVALALEVKI